MELTLKGETLKIYDSIKQMPIKRLQEFEKAILIISGIGGTLEEYDRHFQKIFLFLEKDKKEEAKQELINQRQNFYFVIENFSPSCYAFVWLLSNGIDYTEETAQNEMVRLLNLGITSEMVEEVIISVKKKYLPN